MFLFSLHNYHSLYPHVIVGIVEIVVIVLVVLICRQK